MSTLLSVVLSVILDPSDIVFAVIVVVLGHYGVIEVTYPAWLVRWFTAEDLAPLTIDYSEGQ